MCERLPTVTALLLLLPTLGCGASGPPRQTAEDSERALIAVASRLACLEPARESACEAGLKVSFEAPASDTKAFVRSFAITCESGQPHARIVTRSREIEGPFGQVAWEALWRVLHATGGCAQIGLSSTPLPVIVEGLPHTTPGGKQRVCVEPRFDLGELLSTIHGQVRTGPPRKRADWSSSADGEGHAICDIEPEACRPTPPPCARFEGDPWNGVVAKEERDGLPPEEDPDGPDNEPARSPGKPGDGPPQSEVTTALGARMAAARTCIQGRRPTARARITFESSGRVQHVVVRDGGPAAECIERAFRAARVSPFAASTFEVTVTVRP